MSELSRIKAQIEGAKKTLSEKARDLISEESKTLFDKYSGLTSFGWLGYTPYFNDGDVCEFSVHCDLDYSMYINGESGDDLELVCINNSYFIIDYKNCKKLAKIAGGPLLVEQMINDISFFVYETCGEDVLRVLDEGHITLHRSGKFDIEEYDHE